MQQLMRGVARVVAFSAAVGITAGAIAADPKLPTTPIGTLQDRALVSIAGTITHAFGNKFVLQDDSGHVLVDTGPSWFASRTFAVGERLTVHGRIDGLEFEAREIVRPDGSKESIRPDRGPPHWAGGPKAHGAVGRHQRSHSNACFLRVMAARGFSACAGDPVRAALQAEGLIC